MNTLKRFGKLIVLLAAVLLCAVLLPGREAQAASSGTCGAEGNGSNLTWTLDDAGTLTISGTGAMADYSWYYHYNQDGTITMQTTAPWGVDIKSVAIESGVTSIGSFAFEGCSGLTSVHITDLAAWCAINFANIKNDPSSNPLFYAHKLYLNGEEVTDLVIPESVSTIKNLAFCNCDGLTSVTIPNSVTSIGDSAFCWCRSLTSVTIPDSVTSIGHEAFAWCSSLTSVTIPKSVTSIGSSAFYDCSSLTSVHITDLAAWCAISFENYSNPLNYAHKLYLNEEEVTELVIPDGVTSIGNSAFSACSGLTSVSIPDGVTSIGSGAFSNCTSLTSLTIPFLGTGAEDTAPHLGKLFGTSSGEGLTRVDSGRKEYHSSGYRPTIYYYIPDSLKKVTVTGGVIPKMGFYDCSMLTSVMIPDGVTSIGEYAFSGCSGLTSVMIPDSVTNIGEYAFQDCSGLKVIILPDSVKSIGSQAFAGTVDTSIMYYPGNNQNKTAGFKGMVYGDFDQFMKAFHALGYSFAEFGYSLAELGYAEAQVTILNGTSELPRYMRRGAEQKILYTPDPGCFFAAAALDGVMLAGDSFTVPDKDSFILEIVLEKKYEVKAGGSCGESLNWCVTPENELILYGEGDMTDYSTDSRAPWNQYAGQIKSLRFDGAVTSLGSYAFSGCTALKEVTVPGTVKSIGSYAFSGCKSLSRFVLEEGVEALGEAVLNTCGGLLWQNKGMILLPSTLTSLGNSWWNYTDADCFYIRGGSTDALMPTVGGITWHAISSKSDIAELSTQEVDGGKLSLAKYFAAAGETVTPIFEPDPGCRLQYLTLDGKKLDGASTVIETGGTHSFGAVVKKPTGTVVTGELGNSVKYWIADGELHIYGTGATKNYKWSEGYSSGSSLRPSPLQNQTGYSKVVIEEGVTELGSGVLFRCSGITDISIASSVTTIGAGALSELYELKTLVLPEGLKTIRTMAFYRDYALSSIIIPGSVDSMAQSAFTGTELHSAGPIGSGCDIEFGWTKSIPADAFNGADLNKVILPEGLTSIGANAFKDCDKLKSAGGAEAAVQLPAMESLTSALLGSFPALESVAVPAGTKSIGSNAFSGLNNLKSVTLPAGLESIEEKAFYGCVGLTTIALPQSVTALGASAFEGCSGLIGLVLSPGVTELKGGVFTDCAALAKLGVYKGLSSVAMGAFKGCGLTDVYFEGTEAEWQAITVSPLLNDPLRNAVIHYGTDPQTALTHDHMPGEVVRENETAPTCTEAGSYDEIVYCAVCGAELSRETKTAEALGHDWNEWTVTKEATQEAEGEEAHTCSRCGETETRPIPKLMPPVGDMDGNGALETEDAVLLFKAVSVQQTDPATMDVNGDGKVNNRDAILLFRQAAKG